LRIRKPRRNCRNRRSPEQAAEQDGATNLTQSGKLRDLASAAARVFGWGTEKPAVQFNQLVVTQEQLEQIRTLRDDLFKKPITEGDAT
jgi:hypothetical protein